jgi:two-component system sensor histidine kinase PhoQ
LLITFCAVAVVAALTVALLVDALFRTQNENALRELLDAQLIALIAAAEPGTQGTELSAEAIADSRLNTPGSGVYAQISAWGGTVSWRSRSSIGRFVDMQRSVVAGSVEYADVSLPDGERLAGAWRGLAWEFENPRRTRAVTFAVAVSRAPYEKQLTQIRTRLYLGSLIVALLLIGVLIWAIRSATRPLRQLESELRGVETGERQSLSGDYPRELSGVAAGLNALLDSERRRIARYRDNLADLAHSLKTPIAVIGAVFGHRDTPVPPPADAQQLLARETEKMTALIDRHLKRAALAGGVGLGQAPVAIAPLAAELRATLLRVHGHKDLSLELQVPQHVQFLGDRTDLLEMLGNLLDNACKWCRNRVRLEAQLRDSRVTIVVEDDGPGFPAQFLATGPVRGLRADEQAPGHGLGLAMVRDTAESYGGQLRLGVASLGGASVSVDLPAAPIDATPARFGFYGAVSHRPDRT